MKMNFIKRLIFGLAFILLTAVTASAKPKLTPELMAKIVALIDRIGTNRETAPVYANPLGLSSDGATWANRTTAATDSTDNTFRGFAIDRGTSQDVLLSDVHNGVLFAFHALRDGTLKGAITFDGKTRTLTTRTPAQAQADFDAEVAFWAANVDTLLKK
jgi:hypothetical protein